MLKFLQRRPSGVALQHSETVSARQPQRPAFDADQTVTRLSSQASMLGREAVEVRGAIEDTSQAGARQVEGRELGYAAAAALALAAGCDLVLLCNQTASDGGRAVDEMLDGLADLQAQGGWQPSAPSESRRLALLPQTPPLTWDELMHQSAYQHALARLP